MRVTEGSAGSSGSSETRAPREPRPRTDPFYRPVWWERRFPWLLDALIALDPAPLGRRLSVLIGPLRAVVESLSQPPAAVLDLTGRSIAALWMGLRRALGAAVAALPLPAFLRRWLWLPPRVGDAFPFDARIALRRQYSVVLPLGLMAAVSAHAAMFIYSPSFAVADFTPASEELRAIELPPEIQIPPPPRQISRPATPVIASTQLDEEITIAPTGFDDYVVSDLPPPPSPAADEPVRQPSFTPFTVAPRLLNTDLIEELMASAYPPLLRETGIGGTVVVWAYIDRNGVVEEARVAQSSGYPTMDEAALSVAQHIRTSPALNRDVTVPVWIQIPLEFEVR